jgi:hypothetical protein
MWRQPAAIYGRAGIEDIGGALRLCAQSIRESESIASSWEVLRRQLGWTSVMISKTLHFLCLSLDFNQDPPVPIDGDAVRKKVWPAFRDSVPVGERPGNWKGDEFEAYSRYMTAILAWAQIQQWGTGKSNERSVLSSSRTGSDC